MSQPVDTTEVIVDGLDFARACVLDQRASSHARNDHSYDDRYRAALTALSVTVGDWQLRDKRKASRERKVAAKRSGKKTA